MAHFAPARSRIAWVYFVAAGGPAPMDQRATAAAPCEGHVAQKSMIYSILLRGGGNMGGNAAKGEGARPCSVRIDF
jgi:hypothetical protein